MKGMEINNHREKYLIYPNGSVVSRVNNNTLNPKVNPNGYCVVKLGSEQLSVHRLVATHFIPNPYQYPQVNHKDGNKLNNHVSNLEWCSAEQNAQHALQTGLRSGFVPYDKKLELLNRVLQGALVADVALDLPNTHPNTLSRMLRQTAIKEGLESEWILQMKIRRKNAAIQNLKQINN